MAVGDFPVGSWIEVGEGYLRSLSSGQANVADVEYNVVLPSGGRVVNGGESQPFHYAADGPIPPAAKTIGAVVVAGGFQLLGALAARHGLPVRITSGTINPDGSFTPKSP